MSAPEMSTGTGAVLVLLRAVHDALDLPLPDITEWDEQTHARLLTSRAADARRALAGVLEQGHGMEMTARLLGRWTADQPVTYTPWTDGGTA